MEIQLKILKELDRKYLKELVDILNNDVKLSEHLKSNNKVLSYAEFVAYNNQWAKENNAQIFAILVDDEAIGLISLSQINNENQTAQIGYWITSKYWNRGHTSIAFKKILSLAKKADIKLVSCSIPKDNKESKAIWKKHDAIFEEKDNTIVPSIYL